jgi:hypothetical protein
MDSVLPYLLVAFNKAYDFFACMKELVMKMLNVVIESFIEDLWVFPDTNRMPLKVKDSWIQPPYLNANPHMFFYPSQNKFRGVRNPEISTRGKMTDLITIELVNNTGVHLFEMTEFFNSLRWQAEAAPSLYEMVLVYSIISGVIFTQSVLERCSIVVQTLEHESKKISLTDEVMKRPFSGWV